MSELSTLLQHQRRAAEFVPHLEIISSLPLQMLLTFNMCYFPFWFLTTLLLFQWKVDNILQPALSKTLFIILFSIFSIIESLRVVLGFLGNMRERVPELALCFFFCLLPQIPFLAIFIASPLTIIFPIERAIHFVYLVFMCTEAIFGYLACKRIIQNQSATFYIVLGDGEDENEDSDGDGEIDDSGVEATGKATGNARIVPNEESEKRKKITAEQRQKNQQKQVVDLWRGLLVKKSSQISTDDRAATTDSNTDVHNNDTDSNSGSDLGMPLRAKLKGDHDTIEMRRFEQRKRGSNNIENESEQSGAADNGNRGGRFSGVGNHPHPQSDSHSQQQHHHHHQQDQGSLYHQLQNKNPRSNNPSIRDQSSRQNYSQEGSVADEEEWEMNQIPQGATSRERRRSTYRRSRAAGID